MLYICNHKQKRTHLIKHLGIKSLLDVGCGRGISTSWFITHGLKYVLCVEGSHDAIQQSLIPQIKHIPNRTTYEIVEHDFSRGPWWPSRTVVREFEALIHQYLATPIRTEQHSPVFCSTGCGLVCRGGYTTEIDNSLFFFSTLHFFAHFCFR